MSGEGEDALRASIESMLDDEIEREGPLDAAWLAVWVMDLVNPHVEDTLANLLRPEAIRAAAEAMGDETLARLGRDLGTVHRDAIAEAALRAALAAEIGPMATAVAKATDLDPSS